MGRNELFNAVNDVNLDKFMKLLNTRAKVGEHSENGDTLLHIIVKLIFDNNFNISKLLSSTDKLNKNISEQEKTAKIKNFEKNTKKLIQMAEMLVNKKYIYRLKDTKNTDKYFYGKLVNVFIRFTNYIKKLFISNKKINIDDRDFQGNTILSLISNNSKSDVITKEKTSFKFELNVATKEALFKISNKLINMGANVDIGANINIEDSNHSLPLNVDFKNSYPPCSKDTDLMPNKVETDSIYDDLIPNKTPIYDDLMPYKTHPNYIYDDLMPNKIAPISRYNDLLPNNLINITLKKSQVPMENEYENNIEPFLCLHTTIFSNIFMK